MLTPSLQSAELFFRRTWRYTSVVVRRISSSNSQLTLVHLAFQFRPMNVLKTFAKTSFPLLPISHRTRGVTLTIDPPGSRTFLYLSIFCSLLFAAAPSSSADLGKMSELHGWAMAMSKSMLVPVSGS